MSENKRLLIIDDDPDFVEGIRLILEGADYVVHVEYNPKDGYEALEKDPPDLLLLDIMMGRGAEGIMLARKIRKDPVLREVPVLIITGIREQMAFLFPGEPVHPGFVAIDELVEKPVEPEFLLDRVSALIKASEDRKAQSS
ncbi:MAG: response regulator [Anaerolineales bacterium]|nr:response regulator [Anaerolineales bacterium]MCK4976193.1 response regulator [Anaerolineales bacterium]